MVEVSTMGDSLEVELPALDRVALVRIQVPQPFGGYIIPKNCHHKEPTPIQIAILTTLTTNP